MSNQLIIDAAHPEEVRVAVIKQGRIEDFDFESQTQRSPIGNIYLGKVTRVEPALQACFVDYGAERQGFLPFNDVHPDYFNIPKADKDALLAEEAKRHTESDSDVPDADMPQQPFPHKSASDMPPDMAPQNNDSSTDSIHSLEDNRVDAQNKQAVSQADTVHESEDDLARAQRHKIIRSYKIQEVIKRDQVILVQIAKETRNTKGAALTTYLSLAGRYCVLMPNAYKPRGGAISRKIPQGRLRSDLKRIVEELQIPAQMELIIRTSSAGQPADEIIADHQYLQNLWGDIRTRTLKAHAPALVHEENTLIGRALRDMFKSDITEILIEGDKGHAQAKSFMETLMPNQLGVLKKFDGAQPIFQSLGVDTYLNDLFQPVAPLKSGGYLVINQTEALVAVDVNSGKATRAHSIEKTALDTNLEAAEEIARQARLRDLSGLIVIDFIDMLERRNNRTVESCLKRAIRKDRARIQIGRISGFGLLEMSRQRMRSDIYASTSVPCPHCQASGKMRSVENRSLFVLRQLQAHQKATNGSASIQLFVPQDIATYLENQKQDDLKTLGQAHPVTIHVAPSFTALQYAIGTNGAHTPPEPQDMNAPPRIANTSKPRRSRRGGRGRKRSKSSEQNMRAAKDTPESTPAKPSSEALASTSKEPKSLWRSLFGS